MSSDLSKTGPHLALASVNPIYKDELAVEKKETKEKGRTGTCSSIFLFFHCEPLKAMNKRTEAANNATSSASLLHGRVVCHGKTRRTETIIIALRERKKKKEKNRPTM